MRVHALALLVLGGCAAPSAVHPDTTLGRVVVYKSGVAYFERTATIDDDVLRLSVPPAQMDDFLKSLTVVDERTGAPAPVAYPREGASGTGLVDLVVRLEGPRPHRLKLSYVTEAPSWKPTYRAVLGDKGKVSFEGWAIVDNDSGEDWNRVKLGVGSSSALSFRFDLQSRRSVRRVELSAGDRFAAAPPTGEAPYGAEPREAVVGELADDGGGRVRPVAHEAPEVSMVRIENAHSTVDKHVQSARLQRDAIKVLCLTDKANQLEAVLRQARERRKAADASDDPALAEHERSLLSVFRQRGDQLLAEANRCIGQEAAFLGETRVTMTVDPSLPPDEHESITTLARRQRDQAAAARPAPPSPSPAPAPAAPPRTPGDLASIAAALRAQAGNAVVEGYARPDEPDPMVQSYRRAVEARDRLVAAGVAPERLRVVAKGPTERPERVRVVRAAAVPVSPPREGAAARALAEPIGASHFESPVPLTIGRGASAMISIVKAETDGEVVYLYDAESARGNATFPFRAVRLQNPTDSTLESGPVTVFGEGRFVGEGLCEPIPARSAGFVPFALDRQLVAEARTADVDGAPRLVAATEEVLTTEIERTRRTVVTLYNRLREPAVVYVRHSVPAGYELRRAPAERERLGGAHLFKVSVPASGKADVEIEETSAVTATTDVFSPEGLEALRAQVAAASPGSLRDQLGAVVRLAEEAAGLRQKLGGARARLAGERERADHLRAQITSLRAGRTTHALLSPLDRKLDDLDRRLSQGTLETLALDERLAVLRVLAADASHHLRFSAPPPAGGGGAVRSR